jgi:hypothetical protein
MLAWIEMHLFHEFGITWLRRSKQNALEFGLGKL